MTAAHDPSRETVQAAQNPAPASEAPAGFAPGPVGQAQAVCNPASATEAQTAHGRPLEDQPHAAHSPAPAAEAQVALDPAPAVAAQAAPGPGPAGQTRAACNPVPAAAAQAAHDRPLTDRAHAAHKTAPAVEIQAALDPALAGAAQAAPDPGPADQAHAEYNPPPANEAQAAHDRPLEGQAHPVHSPTPAGETQTAHLDIGLLSPVRVGTPVEAAVGDVAWLQAMLDAEAALARAQARCGTVPRAAARTITAAAHAGQLDVRALALAARETANPVVGLVKAFTAVVAAHAPDAAEYVHRGSTSQDVFDTAAMLVAQRTLRLIVVDLEDTAAALADLAATHRDTVIAGRTLALHAVPTTFGLKAAGWRQLVLESAERLTRLADGGLPVSLGGAAGTLAGYLQYAGEGAGPAATAEALVAAFADETGLAAPVLPWHALRTPVADLGAALAHTAGALGKFAADVLVLARTEVGEVAEPAPAGRGASSAMPHKRNPVLATLIRSAALQLPAYATVLAQCLPAEDERSAGVWHAEWQPLRECLRLAGGAAHTAVELARGLVVRPERMRANLAATGGQIVSERLSAVLAPRLGKAAAKELLTRASLRAADTGRPLAEVLTELPQLRDAFSGPELSALLDPAAYTGAAGPLVDRALASTSTPPTPETSSASPIPAEAERVRL